MNNRQVVIRIPRNISEIRSLVRSMSSRNNKPGSILALPYYGYNAPPALSPATSLEPASSFSPSKVPKKINRNNSPNAQLGRALSVAPRKKVIQAFAKSWLNITLPNTIAGTAGWRTYQRLIHPNHTRGANTESNNRKSKRRALLNATKTGLRNAQRGVHH
jgi:hypothetical protein